MPRVVQFHPDLTSPAPARLRLDEVQAGGPPHEEGGRKY